ncbi:MarR family transcriptional regulator [Nocardia blacklockiae]|uniref:MarR family transcriptional regulator n=1 Tax=Nocardia blacklockiae TaxID=480036 RepID=UPI001892D77D|nr:MarR family transcriptional regulator [Nocardia blacklockiae]MBF6170003.1 MarR family transcriptional regulator [Nocardia blacklockiae]
MPSVSTRAEVVAVLREELRVQATRTVVFHSALASRLGITVTDLSCLNLLRMRGPLTPGELADLLSIARGGAITTVIDRLERAGYVRRSRDAADRRRVRVEPIAVRAEVAVAPLFGELAALADSLPDDDAALAALVRFVQDYNAGLARAASRLTAADAV